MDRGKEEEAQECNYSCNLQLLPLSINLHVIFLIDGLIVTEKFQIPRVRGDIFKCSVQETAQNQKIFSLRLIKNKEKLKILSLEKLTPENICFKK